MEEEGDSGKETKESEMRRMGAEYEWTRSEMNKDWQTGDSKLKRNGEDGSRLYAKWNRSEVNGNQNKG